MPQYQITDTQTGRRYVVTGDAPPTETELQELLTPQAPSSALQLGPSRAAAEEGGLWNTLKTPVVGGLELLGRPGEFVSGFVGGAAQGGVAEGLRRGGAAALEGLGEGKFFSRLADSQQEESFGKVLEEQGILADNPLARTVAGFAADVVTDPLNLLGGAGLLRRGAMKGLKAAGASEQLAKRATGVALGEAYQRRIAQPLGAEVLKQAAKSETLSKLFPSLPLTQLVGKSGRTAEEAQRIQRGLGRAQEDVIRTEVSTLFKDIAPEQRDLIARGIAYPASKEAAAVAATPQLAEAAAQTSARLKQQYGEDVAMGFLPATKTLTLSPKLQMLLNRRTDAERELLLGALKGDAKAATAVAADAGLSRLRKALESTYQRADAVTGELVQFNDPQTLQFVTRQTKAGKTRVLPTISTEMPGYMAAYTEGGGLPGISVFRELRTKIREAKPRSLTFNEAVLKNAPTDAKEILERRLLSSARAKADTDLIRRWADDFAGDAAAPGTAQVSKATLQGMPDELRTLLDGRYLPTPIVDEINRVTARLNDPEKMEGFFTRGTKLFKTVATTLNFPTHQLNNFLGNVANMYASGMDLEKVLPEYGKAAMVLKGRQSYAPLANVTLRSPEIQALGDLLTPAQKAAANAGQAITLTSDQLTKAARSYGVIGEFAGAAAEMPEATKVAWHGRPFTGARNPLNPDLPIYRKMREASTRNVEDPAKLALFVDQLKQGKSLEDATLRVKDVLFDYAELSDAEKQLRNAIPFYTWTRKNIPLQVATLVQSPTKLTHQGRLLQLFTDLSRNDDVTKDVDFSALPSDMQQGETFVLPGIASAKGEPVVGRARLPLFDLNLLSTDPLRRMTGMLNPLYRIPIELGLGQRIDTGGKIYEGYGAASPLSRVTGLGTVAQTTKGPMQPNLQRYALDQLPLPVGSLIRSIPYEGEQGALPFATEFALRGLGYSPTTVTADLLRRTRQRQRQERQQERTQARAERRFQRQVPK